MKTLILRFCVLAMFLGLFVCVGGFVAKAGEPAAVKGDPKAEEWLKKLKDEQEIRLKDKMLLADHYFKSGKSRFDECLYEDAERDFEKALAANPNHEDAKAFLAKTRRIIGKTGVGEVDILSQEILRKRVQLAYQKAVMLKATSDARQFLVESKYKDALEKLEEARNLSKVLAMNLDVTRERKDVDELTDKAVELSKKADLEAEQRKLEVAKALAAQERGRLDELQSQRVQRLFDDAKQLYANMRYLLAAKKAEEILKMEPRNREVMAFLDKCHESQIAQDLKWYNKTQAVETATTWREARKLSIPFSQVQPLFPEDWEEKRQRTAGHSIEDETDKDEAKWKKPIQDKLEETVQFDFVATPLDDVIAFLRGVKKVNIILDKKALEGRGDLLVTLKLDALKFKDALEWVLRLVDLKYTLENGAIYVSTAEKIRASSKTRTSYYDVTDLTIDIRNFTPNLAAISQTGVGEQGAPDPWDTAGDDEQKEDTFTGESLVDFIKSVIAPGTWDEVAGGGGGGGLGF